MLPYKFKAIITLVKKELVDLAHELQSLVPLHICGKTHKIVDQMTDTGADVISIDKCDLGLAREKVAGRALILGNIDPADEMLFGPAERIHSACIEAIDTMKGYSYRVLSRCKPA
ncbi:MAG TPA: hypothetical protein DCZ10_14920 [Pelotomaculum sp.]|nr:hypothetical protein [Pelotomaculum sp.]